MGQVILVVLVTVTMLTGCAAIAVAPRKVPTRPSQRARVGVSEASRHGVPVRHEHRGRMR
jgi:uncharacterized protein YceK